MKSAVGFLKATIVGGALYLIPVSLILILLAKVHAIATDIVSPIATGLELRDVGGINAARLLAVLAILLLCFIAGLFARTSVARRSIGWLERTILSNLPGYSAVAAIGQQTFTSTGTTRQLRTVLARIEDAWQFALLVEQIDEALLILPRQADRACLVNRLACRLLGGRDHEITDAAALQRGGTLHHGERLRCDARFDPSRASRFPRHQSTPRADCTVFYLTYLYCCATGWLL